MQEKIYPSKYLFVIADEEERINAISFIQKFLEENNFQYTVKTRKANSHFILSDSGMSMEIIQNINESVRGRKEAGIVINYSHFQLIAKNNSLIYDMILNTLCVDYLYKNKVSGLIFTEDLMMTLEKILNMELKEENIK